jgi:outer membrane immunogenic protein
MSLEANKKGYLLASAGSLASVALAGGAAQAADLPIKPIPAAPVAVAAPSWAGWYIGGNIGIVHQQATNSANNYGYEVATANVSSNNFGGGGQIGYNWQSGNYVFGLEGDITGVAGNGGKTISTTGRGKNFSSSITWLSTLRFRTGLAVGDTLVYATGGLAVGEVKNALNFQFNGYSVSQSQTRVGWTIGGGVEHMLWDHHWTVGLEGLYVDLGQSTVNGTGPATGWQANFQNQAIIGRLKLNYKF